jgi:hypothetical protein
MEVGGSGLDMLLVPMATGALGHPNGDDQITRGPGYTSTKKRVEAKLILIFPTKGAPKEDNKLGIRPGPLPIGPIGEPINGGPECTSILQLL